jgi:hypothetical protein
VAGNGLRRGEGESASLPTEGKELLAIFAGAGGDVMTVWCKPRHNFVYLSADLSRPYRFIVTPQICVRGLSPGGSLFLAPWGMIAGEVGLS